MASKNGEPTQGDLSLVESLIHRAKVLEHQRQANMRAIDSNRQLLRQLDSNEVLDEAQGAWLDTFYPVKSQGATRSPEQVTATRDAKVAAAKEVSEAAQNTAGITPAAA